MNPPLDRLSALVMLSQAGDEDLLRVMLPFPYPHTLNKYRCYTRPRVYCKKHARVLWARATSVVNKRDTWLDFVQEAIFTDQMEEATRRGDLRVFEVRGAHPQTWRECRHCRWGLRHA